MAFSVSGTNVIDSSRNIINAANGTFSGTVTAPTFSGNLNGNASTVTNGVYTTGNQTIAGTKTFTGVIDAFGSTGGMSVNNAGTRKLEVRSAAAGNAAYMTFHIPGQFAVRAGLDTDNVFKVGGWSLGNASWPVLLGSFTNNANHLTLRGGAPTLVLRDTDGRTGYVHVNGNLMYFLRGNNDVDYGQWTTVNGRWPLILNLNDNNASFGGGIFMDQSFLQVSGTRFRVNALGNNVQSSNIFNNGTTAGTNMHVRGGDFLIERNVSSIKYKHSVETLDTDISDYVIRNIRPVWYRSKCINDTPDWSWYGFIAEEVAEIEPRLCHWDVPIIEEETDQYEQPESYTNGNGELITPDPIKIVKKYQDPNAPKEVEGVMYERFTVLLVDQVQKLIKKVESLEEKITSIENRLNQ